MATDIIRDFDPNLELPIGLKNVDVKPSTTEGQITPENNVEIDPQLETLDDEDSELDEDFSNDILEPPGDFVIVSQTVRTGSDGTQVVDVIIEVEDMPGAVDYQFRITTS